MTPVIRYSERISGNAPSLSGRDLESNSGNGASKDGSSRSNNSGYNKYGGQGGYGSSYGYGPNNHQPKWSSSSQPLATSAFEIVHFTSVSHSTTQTSFSPVPSPSIVPASTTSTSDYPALTPTLSSSPNIPKSNSLSAFNLVPTMSLPAPSALYPSPTIYDYGGIVGGMPSSPSPSPSPSSSPQSDIQRPMSLGIIAAIILGSLFIIVLSLVVYVVTRPKFGSLARLWRRPKAVVYQYPPRMTSMASFEPKEYMDRQTNMYLPEDPSRPMSRSLLLPDFQSVPSPRDGNSGEATPRSPPAVFNAARNEHSRPNRVASWRSSKSASISVASRSPTRKHKSITRIMSILEGYPFQHEISSTEGIGSRSESPNWSSTDHDYYARSIPVSVPTGD